VYSLRKFTVACSALCCVFVGPASGIVLNFPFRRSEKAAERAEFRKQWTDFLISCNNKLKKIHDDILNHPKPITSSGDLLSIINHKSICQEINRLDKDKIKKIKFESGTTSDQKNKRRWTCEEIFKVKHLAAELDIKKVRYKIPRVGSDFLCSVLADIMSQAF